MILQCQIAYCVFIYSLKASGKKKIVKETSAFQKAHCLSDEIEVQDLLSAYQEGHFRSKITFGS